MAGRDAGGKPRLIVILGPTAVGKTALSIELARALHTEILSGDSMLVYRGMDIGTAKPTQEERQGVPHHLVDILPPDRAFNVTDFIALARPLILRLNGQGRIPILAGGTGLYLQALLEGYRFNETEQHEMFRRRLYRLAERRGKDFVHALLARKDPEAAGRLHSHDVRRVVRALEVVHFGQESISREKQMDGRAGTLCYDALVIGLNRDRQALYERINRRAEIMFEHGLENEVRALLEAGVPRDSQAMKGIGYKETASFLAGEISRGEALLQIQKATRHFAKRQLTWYRRMKYIHWYMVDEIPADRLLPQVLKDVEGFFSLR